MKNAIEIIKSNFVSEAGDTCQQIINKQQKKHMSEDDRLQARLLGKQVDDADDEIGERRTILFSVSGSGVSKRKKATHLQKSEGPMPMEL